jgi:1-acyl-sn-glycerol-3-phosphate acyltransferase
MMMWLLPASSVLAKLAAYTFYRFSCVGPRPPGSGPLLLVANHPNSLVDAVLVAAVAGRPVRFLAKAPLFSLKRIGWLLRAVGAIPVHRRIDDEKAVDQNIHAFQAVFEALSRGAAIGVFPEGLSHSEPALARLKTGSARMALGFAGRHGRPLPLVPVGFVLREKARFRSEAMAFFGDPIVWDDLADRGDEDRNAVRELTRRIDTALRQVTVNLEQWEDEPLVRCVEEIWQAEIDEKAAPEAQLVRVRTTTEVLASLRRQGNDSWIGLARSLESHRRRLARLRLTPSDLKTSTDVTTALAWTLRRLHILAPVAFLAATIGAVLYWPPYRLTRLAARMAPPDEDVQSTYKLMSGMVLYPLWTLLLGGLAWWFFGPWRGGLVLVVMPLVAVVGLWIRERWRGAWSDVRRYFTMRSRRELVAALQRRQSDLTHQLRQLYESWQSGEVGRPPPVAETSRHRLS